MERMEVEKAVADIKKRIQKSLKKQQCEAVLELVSLCANILYYSNIYYTDSDLEQALTQTSKNLLPYEKCESVAATADYETVLFYDGFGLDNRGLVKIYLKALGEKKKIYYVTYKNRAQQIPGILNIIQASGGRVSFLEKGNKIDQIRQLNEILKESKAGHFVFYSYPNDVVATTLLYAYEGLLKRYQINLTDHAFWLGTHCMDVCIEFREYGASISREYRNIPQKKITLLPFYPDIDKEQKFLGFPFAVKPGNKVIFSGGSLYKTLGKGNKYYEIVEHLLSKHEEAIFWYAGTGDDFLMRQLMAKYPHRLFLTEERKDLFQLLQNCYFYLSTYPICGGLMYQYAACAGKTPLTLRNDDDNAGYLLNQESLGIEFDDIEDLKQEIDRFMDDEGYAAEKSAAMKNCVITVADFQKELTQILECGVSSYKINYQHLDTEEFRQLYLDNLTSAEMDEFFADRKLAYVLAMKYPCRFLRGAWHKVCRKMRNKLHIG